MVTYSLLGNIDGILFQFTGVPVSSIKQYLHISSVLIFFPFALIGILIWNSILVAIASIITNPNNSWKSSLMLLPILFILTSF
ncbi:MAG: hypothetical protein IPM32_18055 [Ignavibacteriae bacterium]|nr:hypothetical protein [Ignavibacteriota bacterium]